MRPAGEASRRRPPISGRTSRNVAAVPPGRRKQRRNDAAAGEAKVGTGRSHGAGGLHDRPILNRQIRRTRWQRAAERIDACDLVRPQNENARIGSTVDNPDRTNTALYCVLSTFTAKEYLGYSLGFRRSRVLNCISNSFRTGASSSRFNPRNVTRTRTGHISVFFRRRTGVSTDWVIF